MRGEDLKLDLNSDKPIFLQISEEIEDGIFTGAFPEETQIPSTTEISTTFKINPATVLKGMNQLVDEGFIYKQRGVGMFVTAGAVAQVKKKRQREFYQKYVEALLKEAKKLMLSKNDVMDLIERGYEDESN